MQPENVDEYKLVREEMLVLKNCITNYVSIGLGGAGAAIAAYAVLPTREDSTLALSALALALIITLILNVLVYKFHSHNRLAGYCKLLTQEQCTYNPKGKPGSIYLWELMLSELRVEAQKSLTSNRKWSWRKPATIIKTLRDASFQWSWRKPVTTIKALHDALFRRSAKKIKRWWHPIPGLWLFAKASLTGGRQWLTWEFPFYIVAIFLALVILFASASVLFATKSGTLRNVLAGHPLVFIPAAIIAITWFHYFGALYRLMKGAYSIDAFAERFCPIRQDLLKSYGLQTYALISRMRKTGRAEA